MIIDTAGLVEIGRVPGAGGIGAPEVLYDVSYRSRSADEQPQRSDALSLFLGIDSETRVVDLSDE